MDLEPNGVRTGVLAERTFWGLCFYVGESIRVGLGFFGAVILGLFGTTRKYSNVLS